MDVANVTRFEVVDWRGTKSAGVDTRVLTAHGVRVELSLQDDGRTLKVFLRDRGDEASQEDTD